MVRFQNASAGRSGRQEQQTTRNSQDDSASDVIDEACPLPLGRRPMAAHPYHGGRQARKLVCVEACAHGVEMVGCWV
jgi:hypothetical protein